MAGKSSVFQGLIRGSMDGALSPLKCYPILFTADDTDASFEVFTIPAEVAADLVDFAFTFGTVAPSGITYLIKDHRGRKVAGGTIAASTDRDNLAGAVISLVGGGTITLSGNLTNSATVILDLYFEN